MIAGPNIRSGVRRWLMKHLAPVMSQSSPSLTARVSRAARSAPPLGSVRRLTEVFSPLRMGVRNSCFCSSVPQTTRAGGAEPLTGETSPLRKNSSAMMAACSWLNPPPPYSAGMVGDSQPFSAKRTSRSRAKEYCSSVRSFRSTGSVISSGMFSSSQARASTLNVSCSSEYR